MKKSLGLLTLTSLVVVLVTACGGAKDYNDSDIAFAQGMVPHHAQAVVMAEQALKTSQDDDIRALATQIKAAQDPEIKTMNAWLDDWDAASGHEDMGDMDGMKHSTEGMMTKAEMKTLETETGEAFDTAWLTLMIKHHEGAVEQSKTELKDGKNGEAKKLAQQIIDGQEAEIATMQGLLGS